MKVEHWQNDVENTETVVPQDYDAKMKVLLCGKDAKLCCVIEADSWADAMTKYHEHQGWGPYVPIEERKIPE